MSSTPVMYEESTGIVWARPTDLDGAPVEGASVSLTISDQDGAQVQGQAWPVQMIASDPGDPGYYTYRVAPGLLPGRRGYEAKVVVVMDDDQRTSKLRFRVDPDRS